MEKQFKKSNFLGARNTKQLEQYVNDLDRDVFNLVEYVKSFPKFYNQSAEPSIPSDSIAVWHDSDDGSTYWLVNYSGTQTSVELT